MTNLKHPFRVATSLVILLATLLVAMCLPITAQASPAGVTLRKGDESAAVTAVQQQLVKKGYLFIDPTGYFGEVTEVAVRNFQKMNDLLVDGICGPRTLEKLFGADYQIFVANAGASTLNAQGTVGSEFWVAARAKYPDALLLGDTSSAVTKLQNRLKELGYYTYHTATGYYGSVTLIAVRDFQANNGCAVDGIVGQKTADKLYSTSAKKAGSSTSSSRTSTSQAASSSGSSRAAAAAPANQTRAQKVISYTKQQIGLPYVYGAAGPRSFDCSGLMQYAFKNSVGVSLNRSSYDQGNDTRYTKISSMSSLQAGDLIFFNTRNNRISHVGLYIGNNQMVHAPGTGKSVCIVSTTTAYWTSRFVCGRRVL